MGMFFLTRMIIYIFMYDFFSLKHRHYIKAVVKLNLKNGVESQKENLYLTCCSGSRMFQTLVVV